MLVLGSVTARPWKVTWTQKETKIFNQNFSEASLDFGGVFVFLVSIDFSGQKHTNIKGIAHQKNPDSSSLFWLENAGRTHQQGQNNKDKYQTIKSAESKKLVQVPF